MTRLSSPQITWPPAGELTVMRASASGFSLPSSPQRFSGASNGVGEMLYGSADSGGVTYYFNLFRLNYSTGSTIKLILSGFGVMSSMVDFQIIGYDPTSGDYYIYVKTNGGSSVMVNDRIYPVTVSGDTATLGTAIVPPTIGGKVLSSLGLTCGNDEIVAVWYDSTSGRIDAARYYDISGASWGTTVNAPYDVNTDAVGGVGEHWTQSSNAQSGKAYGGVLSTTGISVFIEYDFATHTFIDKSTIIHATFEAVYYYNSIICDPAGEFVIVLGLEDGGVASRVSIYDRAGDKKIFDVPFYQVLCLATGLPGSESDGILAFSGTSNIAQVIPWPFLEYTGPGVFCGAESHDFSTSTYASSAVAWQIDGGEWVNIHSSELWDKEGFNKIMKSFDSSLRGFVVPHAATVAADMALYYTKQ